VGLPPRVSGIASASMSATQAILQPKDAFAVMSQSAAPHFRRSRWSVPCPWNCRTTSVPWAWPGCIAILGQQWCGW